jgi:DMSO/TMAO reductase YedYZ molybdopterin-dependent catalytic subunit
MARIRKSVPGVDANALIKEAGKLMPDASRRAFLRGAASLGALTMLTGCDIVDEDSAEGALRYAIGSWQGAVLSDFLKRIGADTRAKYLHFKCAEGYTETIDMPTALHPQTQMTFKFDNKILPRAYGFPMKIRIPTKLGFKQPKYVVAMEVTNVDRGGYWSNQGYNWFSGL